MSLPENEINQLDTRIIQSSTGLVREVLGAFRIEGLVHVCKYDKPTNLLYITQVILTRKYTRHISYYTNYWEYDSIYPIDPNSPANSPRSILAGFDADGPGETIFCDEQAKDILLRGNPARVVEPGHFVLRRKVPQDAVQMYTPISPVQVKPFRPGPLRPVA